MKGHAVCVLIVDTFDDVNLALVRPVVASRPECRPCPANATRHMSQINDDEAAVVRDLALETNTPSSWVLSYVGVVDTNIDLAVVVVDESIMLSVALAEVVGVSVRGRIRSRDEVEHVEEVVRIIVVRAAQGIASYTEANEPSGRKEGREKHDLKLHREVCVTRRDTDT